MFYDPPCLHLHYKYCTGTSVLSYQEATHTSLNARLPSRYFLFKAHNRSCFSSRESKPGNILYSIIEYLAAIKPHSVLMTKISFTVRNNKKNNNDFLKDKYMRIKVVIVELNPLKLLS